VSTVAAVRKRPARPTRPAGGAQERAERTRAAIMDETVRCVIEEGFAAASARHIAEGAGVTWGVIQYHFGDRAGLLSAVVESGFDELNARIEAVDTPAGPTRDRVAAIVDAAWAAFSAPRSRASLEILVGTRAHRSRAVDRQLVEMAATLTQLGGRLVEERHRAQGPAAIGELLWATLRGLAVAQLVVAVPLDLTPVRATLVDALVAYLESAESNNPLSCTPGPPSRAGAGG
jgi:TetR/AcrR family transcriptional regulator, regulator of cefoperazone and chloramphenicol sensitivity